MPGNWPEVPSGATAEDPLPIQVVGLPTQAPWLNPIEKLWRYLKQEVVHLHQEENFALLHDHVDAFQGRVSLLRSWHQAHTVIQGLVSPENRHGGLLTNGYPGGGIRTRPRPSCEKRYP